MSEKKSMAQLFLSRCRLLAVTSLNYLIDACFLRMCRCEFLFASCAILSEFRRVGSFPKNVWLLRLFLLSMQYPMKRQAIFEWHAISKQKICSNSLVCARYSRQPKSIAGAGPLMMVKGLSVSISCHTSFSTRPLISYFFTDACWCYCCWENDLHGAKSRRKKNIERTKLT